VILLKTSNPRSKTPKAFRQNNSGSYIRGSSWKTEDPSPIITFKKRVRFIWYYGCEADAVGVHVDVVKE
jgi:hypothetical protein